MLTYHTQGWAIESKFIAWSSTAQLVCQRAFNLLEIWFQRPWFESWIQQRKTTCLLLIPKSFACARASKLTTTNVIHPVFCLVMPPPPDSFYPSALKFCLSVCLPELFHGGDAWCKNTCSCIVQHGGHLKVRKAPVARQWTLIMIRFIPGVYSGKVHPVV